MPSSGNINAAQAFRESEVRRAKGEASRFLALLAEYSKARDVTRERLYLEAMERIFANPELEKIILSDKALSSVVPYLPLEKLAKPKTTEAPR